MAIETAVLAADRDVWVVRAAVAGRIGPVSSAVDKRTEVGMVDMMRAFGRI